MGVNPPSLYAAFGNKVGLFAVALEHYLAHDGRYLPEALTGGTPVAAAIAGLLDKAALLFTDDGVCRGCLVMDGAGNSDDPAAIALTGQYKARTRKLIRDRVAQENEGQASVIADFVMVTLAGLSAAARGGASRRSLRQSARLAAVAVEAALAPRA